MLRHRARLEINGKELALAAGVTPTLVRYYFQTRASLIEAVAQPVVDQYLDQLKSVLRQDTSVEERFRSLIILFLKISREDGQLIDSYVAYVKDQKQAPTHFLASAYLELDAFFVECEASQFLRASNRAVTQTVLWGVCKTIAQTTELDRFISENQADIAEKQAALILNLLVYGLRYVSGPTPEPQHVSGELRM